MVAESNMRNRVVQVCVILAVVTGGAIADDASASVVVAAMADGIGDLTYASADWVDAARSAFEGALARHEINLKEIGSFTMCEVAHNPPAFLHGNGPLAWNVKIEGASVHVAAGELPDDVCDYKIVGDHSIMSLLRHIQHHGNDPDVVANAEKRLRKLSRWKTSGRLSDDPVLQAVLRSAHDAMAPRTMPRFVWMSPEWVSTARHIVSTRARLPEFADGLVDVEYTFSEVFTDAPAYVAPDGSDTGFWVVCSRGEVTVGAGPLPTRFGSPDYLNKMLYTPVVPVGRTVNTLMTDADIEEQKGYSASAFGVQLGSDEAPIVQWDREKNKPFPDGLGAVMRVLHDELSLRTSGELPSDYDESVRPEWAKAQRFDRVPGYDASWVRYDEVDIYGEPLQR